jgi:hypothetical protein
VTFLCRPGEAEPAGAPRSSLASVRGILSELSPIFIKISPVRARAQFPQISYLITLIPMLHNSSKICETTLLSRFALLQYRFTTLSTVRAHKVGRGTQRSAGIAFTYIPWGVRNAHGSLARPKHRFKAAHDMGFLEISIRIQTKPAKLHF